MNSWWFVAISMAAGCVAFGRVRIISPRGTPETAVDATLAPMVTVVIPARNEASSLPHLLDDLGRSRPVRSRVIVIDDHSTDDTAQIAAGYDFVTLLRAPDLPTGWTGKSWACHTGAQAADDGELVFLDADVRLGVGALDEVLARRRALGGVVSVQPYHLVPTWAEQLSGLFNVVAMMGTGAGSKRPNGIFGPVICCAADDYRSIGGHRSVRSEVVEDVALGRRFQRFGVPLHVFGGGGSIQFRMYPDGWRTMVEGWSKNMATGAAGTPVARALATFTFICGLVTASMMSVEMVRSLVESASIDANSTVGAGLAVTVVAALLRRVGSFRPSGWFAFPVLTLFFVAIVARSRWLTLVRRKVTWRGRAIPIGPPILATTAARAQQ